MWKNFLENIVKIFTKRCPYCYSKNTDINWDTGRWPKDSPILNYYHHCKDCNLIWHTEYKK